MPYFVFRIGWTILNLFCLPNVRLGSINYCFYNMHDGDSFAFVFTCRIIGNFLLRSGTKTNHREIFLPGSSRSEWIKSTDPVDCMSLSPGQIWSMLINLGCSNHSVCSAHSDHLNLFILYLINLVVIDWLGWSGHSYQSVHIPISLPLLLCSFSCLDSGKVVILLRSRLLVTYYLVVLFVENPQLYCNKYSNAHTNTLTPTQTHSRTWKTPTPSQ